MKWLHVLHHIFHCIKTHGDKENTIRDDTWHHEFENDYAMWWCRCAKDFDRWLELHHLDFNMWF